MKKIFKKRFSKNKIILIGTFLFLFLLAIPTFFWMKSTNKDMAERHKSQMSPAIMIPGSSATIDRFNELVGLLNQGTLKKHSLLKIEVQTDGSLKYSGKINKGDNQPFIVVGFQDNRDGYSNIKKQVVWFNIAFNKLTQQYKFNNFKGFGHSNGGLIWTYWLEHHYETYSSDIEIKELMTLGTPYNFSEKNSNNKTQMLSDLIKDRANIPETLNVYSVSGGETYDSDGLVPESSVAAGKYIFQNQVKQYTTMTVTGADAGHSSLPQNKQVIELIKQYLLDSDKPTQAIRNNRKKPK